MSCIQLTLLSVCLCLSLPLSLSRVVIKSSCSSVKIPGASSHADLDSASDLNSITDADATSFCETDDTARYVSELPVWHFQTIYRCLNLSWLRFRPMNSRISVETTSTITSLKPRRKVLTKTRPKVPRVC